VNAQPYPIEETNGLAALLDPSTLTWTNTGSMNKSRIGETMTILPNGQALVAGGQTFDKHLGTLSRLPAPNSTRRRDFPRAWAGIRRAAEFFRLAVASISTARSRSTNESEHSVYISRFLDSAAGNASAGARAGGTEVPNPHFQSINKLQLTMTKIQGQRRMRNFGAWSL